MPAIAYVRPEVSFMKHKWDLVKDCLIGEKHIKQQRQKYLPQPNSTDKSKENKARYEAYLERASFYPVTSATLDGMLGQVFDTDPVIEIPDDVEYLKNDITGSGISMAQAASKTLGEVLAYGRSGLLVDYPSLDAVTRLDVQLGVARPIVCMYDPFSIINWRTICKGAKTVLTLVVFAECYVAKDDGFEIEEGFQWRVCRCDDTTGNMYKVELWIEDGNDYVIKEEYWPLDAKGVNLDFIPFTFAGAVNNDTAPDHPPLYGIASINIKHYRNSADYEDSVFMVGQPTPVVTGLKKDWVDNVLKSNIQLGSRGIVPLPEGATMDLVQAEANGMVKEAMDQKEAQMIALGAQLIQPQNVARTLGEAQMDKNSQTSILAKCAQNVSAAFTQALSWCGVFTQGEEYDVNEVFLQLSTTFAISKMSPQDQQQLLLLWQGDGLTWSEFRGQLRMAGLATEDDDLALEVIQEEAQQRQSLALDQLAAETAITGPPVDPNAPGNQA